MARLQHASQTDNMWKKTIAFLMAGILTTMTSACNSENWEEGKRYGQWVLAFDGNGAVKGNDSKVTMYPQRAEDADTTHACLVYTDRKYGDAVNFEITVNTEDQVRQSDPNPWEVGWVLWNYENNDRFYALVLKPNGWELSKQDPQYPGHQRFLASDHEPVFDLHQGHKVHVIQEGNRVRFYADGKQLGEYTDEERPYYGGSIGLYTEDARVIFSNLKVFE